MYSWKPTRVTSNFISHVKVGSELFNMDAKFPKMPMVNKTINVMTQKTLVGRIEESQPQ